MKNKQGSTILRTSEILLREAIAQFKQGHVEKAGGITHGILKENPGHADASHLLGVIAVRNGQYEEAIPLFAKAVRGSPRNPIYHFNHGVALSSSGHNKEALVAYNHAIQLNPQHAEAHNNRGTVLWILGYMEQALAAYDCAIKLKPQYAEAYDNRGNALRDLGKLADAETSFRKAIQLKPGYEQAYSNMLLSLNYREDLLPQQVYEVHRQWGLDRDRFSNNGQYRDYKGTDPASRKLRIGYISPDFRRHSVAYFFEPLINSHCRDLFEIYCYSNVNLPDNVTLRIKEKADHWLSIVGETDGVVAKRIQTDHIDILVDLAGHTNGNRLAVFGYGAAPAQVTWLGYPNTTGMQDIDYRLTDAIADPVNEAGRLYTEELVRLDNGFLCYQPPEFMPEVSRSPFLDNGYITFASFNNLTKVNPSVIRVWSEVLCAIPGSRLLLKGKVLASELTRKRYLEEFQKHGVARKQIILCEQLASVEDHLKLYGRVDVGLDTFPYNGTTTTCEALYMGVPVVSLRGNCHAARVGASILHYAGFPEWVASTTSLYVERAVRLATDKEELEKLRQNLRICMQESRFCDTASFAQSVERAYRQMWVRYIERI